MRGQQNVIAIIDDDPGMRDALELLLSAEGYRTEQFASADEFINAVTTSEATCLVVDIQLGGTSGLDLGRKLSTMERNFPIIFMTGCHDAGIQKQAMDFGCAAFLHKPFPAEQLIESVAMATNSNARLSRN